MELSGDMLKACEGTDVVVQLDMLQTNTYIGDSALSECIIGTSSDDTIYGYGGNDVIIGLEGDDRHLYLIDFETIVLAIRHLPNFSEIETVEETCLQNFFFPSQYPGCLVAKVLIKSMEGQVGFVSEVRLSILGRVYFVTHIINQCVFMTFYQEKI